ncbi:MAG: hypothetical protein KME15_19910 [Drouetiella hepatica Uher 2000/2452]|jgi:hypothetical protein|uniref:Uncharacterized protein n=1 Tax=Drouetiella hepatica Uher 2000/2452 TaxID=904376 RepID=A0A951QDS0_9CYAN|nr:hypothetical protein [Drouetiella hepatica Uher 2000/2452]
MMTDLTDKQKAVNWETLKHIEMVMQLLATMQNEIARRMFSHDRSKLTSPELEMFEQFTDKLAGLTYGSEEYEACRQEMLKTALGHHYENNRHHPEFFVDGVEGMNLIDLIEMVCDWKAATLRHNDGNIFKSIEYNANRFGLSPQLVKIISNTVPLLHSVYGRKTQKHLNDYWHCLACGAGDMEGNFCCMCGAGKHDFDAVLEPLPSIDEMAGILKENKG